MTVIDKTADILLQKRLEAYGIERLIVLIAKLTARVNELEQKIEFMQVNKPLI